MWRGLKRPSSLPWTCPRPSTTCPFVHQRHRTLRMAKRTIRLITESFPSCPEMDVAVSRVILERVSGGEEPETLRLYRPGAMVAFGPQDTRAPGYQQAVEAARARGFKSVRRLSGGRAAVFHEETIGFAWTIPDPDPRGSVDRRFEEVSSIMAKAFRRLGIDVQVGEVPGEYCPGRYSVNARGKRKLMGVGQRLKPAAAHVGGVVVVGGSIRIQDVLLSVYDALQVEWDPTTVGSVQDEVPDTTYDQVRDAILDAFTDRYQLAHEQLTPEAIDLSQQLRSEHLAP